VFWTGTGEGGTGDVPWAMGMLGLNVAFGGVGWDGEAGRAGVTRIYARLGGNAVPSLSFFQPTPMGLESREYAPEG
jgi:hypothetical protein